jgi:cyclomaltodextrinase / maltogenic alpha-amylase / neopullulanase
MGLEDISEVVRPGKYEHFKGNLYEVLFCARHSEDLLIMVIYKDVKEGLTWARPINEFLRPLPDGKKRFKFIEG